MVMVLGWVTAPPPPVWAASSSAAPWPSTTYLPCSPAPWPSTARLPCSSLSYRSCGQNRRHRQLYRLQATTTTTTTTCNTDHVHDDRDDGCHQAATSSTFRSSRGLFLQRLASSALAGSSALSISPGAASSLDAQRDARTARSPPPALLLPVERLRAAVINVTQLLQDPTNWEEARSQLRSAPLSQPDFSKILDRYSDSNWEKHMMGDLYRNEGLANMKALDEIMAFALQQQASGVDITQDDIDDVREAGRALAASLDDFLSLAPSADLQLVQKLVNP